MRLLASGIFLLVGAVIGAPLGGVLALAWAAGDGAVAWQVAPDFARWGAALLAAGGVLVGLFSAPKMR